MKKEKKQRIHKDSKGEYILQKYFVRGKQKFNRIYVIEGVPAEEYYTQNADPITLLQNGDYEFLESDERV